MVDWGGGGAARLGWLGAWGLRMRAEVGGGEEGER